ncbi:MAG: glycerol-3-phosphate dehydrogenase C-terminal domain-containing protein, partial [Asticcacaulis sp.]
RTLIGTTDTAVPTISLEPRPLDEEIDFILRTSAAYLTRVPQRSDILSVFAGLRPLVKAEPGTNSKDLSREHTILVSESGLITLTGGKWTTCRRMGEDVMDRAEAEHVWPNRPSRTPYLHLHGWSQDRLSDNWAVYGSDAAEIQKMPKADVRLHPDLPYVEAQVVWSVQHEQARTVEDVLARRLRALLLDARASMAAAPRVAQIMADELGRDTDWQADQVAQYRALAEGYLPS